MDPSTTKEKAQKTQANWDPGIFRSPNENGKKPETGFSFYQAPSISYGAWKSIGMSLLVTFGIFTVLPLTRYIGQFTDTLSAYMSSDIPEEPPPVLEELKVEEEEEIEEELEEPELNMEEVEPISLTELQASLHAGTGTGGFGSSRGFDELFFEVQDIGNMIFEIKDLDNIPRLISSRRPVYPPELQRNKIEGEVVLLVMINPEGRVSVLGIKKSTNREFELAAIKAARSARYTPPVRNGEKVSVKFLLPFYFTISD